MKAENEMTLTFPSRSANESFARAAVACFAAQLDPTLDELIMEARSSSDQAFRKATYKDCLDIILDWAVEVPIYQRQNCVIISAKRVNLDTVTPDITTYWTWYNDIELLDLQ